MRQLRREARGSIAIIVRLKAANSKLGYLGFFSWTALRRPRLAVTATERALIEPSKLPSRIDWLVFKPQLHSSSQIQCYIRRHARSRPPIFGCAKTSAEIVFGKEQHSSPGPHTTKQQGMNGVTPCGVHAMHVFGRIAFLVPMCRQGCAIQERLLRNIRAHAQ